MSPAVSHQRCRTYGDFIPLAEVSMLLINGWRIVDDLAGDPAGNDFALMQPPAEMEAA